MLMIDEIFDREKEAVDDHLIYFFERLHEEEKDLLFNDFIDQLEEFIIPEDSKAKRIHPILLIMAFSGIINPIYLEDQIDEIRRVSIAVELLHSGHLIHDDLIDDDRKRRGNLTFHVQLREELRDLYKDLDVSKGEKIVNNYGRDMSILGGSLGYLLGFDILKNSNFPEKLKLNALNEYTEAMNFLMKGQILEEYMEYHNLTMSMEQYLDIAELQRARVFEKSTKIGAILAKGNEHYQIKPLSDAILRIGQAYAIRDDILDLKKDIEGKKKKFIYILAVQNTTEDQSRTLNELYNKPGKLTNKEINKIEQIFAETNSIIIAEHFSKNLVEQAKSYLKDIYPDLNKKEKSFFNEFSDYIYMREF